VPKLPLAPSGVSNEPVRIPWLTSQFVKAPALPAYDRTRPVNDVLKGLEGQLEPETVTPPPAPVKALPQKSAAEVVAALPPAFRALVRAKAAAAVDGYLDKVASELPPGRRAHLRSLQAHLAAGHSLEGSVKLAYPHLPPRAAVRLARRVAEKAAAEKRAEKPPGMHHSPSDNPYRTEDGLPPGLDPGRAGAFLAASAANPVALGLGQPEFHGRSLRRSSAGVSVAPPYFNFGSRPKGRPGGRPLGPPNAVSPVPGRRCRKPVASTPFAGAPDVPMPKVNWS
jgi:hypothetical protein